MKAIGFCSVMAFSMVMVACWTGNRKIAARLPPPPMPSLTKPAPVFAPPSDAVVPLATTPEATQPSAPVADPKPATAPPATNPAVAGKPRPSVPRPLGTGPKPPAEAEMGTAPPAAAPLPQLRELLTPERRARYESDFSQSMTRARAAVSKTSGHRLTTAQQQTVNRIRTFVTQADQSRKGDLATALQLARRADLLGEELLKSLH